MWGSDTKHTDPHSCIFRIRFPLSQSDSSPVPLRERVINVTLRCIEGDKIKMQLQHKQATLHLNMSEKTMRTLPRCSVAAGCGLLNSTVNANQMCWRALWSAPESWRAVGGTPKKDRCDYFFFFREILHSYMQKYTWNNPIMMKKLMVKKNLSFLFFHLKNKNKTSSVSSQTPH